MAILIIRFLWLLSIYFLIWVHFFFLSCGFSCEVQWACHLMMTLERISGQGTDWVISTHQSPMFSFNSCLLTPPPTWRLLECFPQQFSFQASASMSRYFHQQMYSSSYCNMLEVFRLLILPFDHINFPELLILFFLHSIFCIFSHLQGLNISPASFPHLNYYHSDCSFLSLSHITPTIHTDISVL